MNDEQKTVVKVTSYILVATAMVVIATLAGCPQYEVYRQRLHGEAELARAHSNRMILVAQAEAEKQSAQLRADAIAIVGKAAKEFPEYRQQEYIGAFADALRHGSIAQIIYVPTEASIPMLEAGKR